MEARNPVRLKPGVLAAAARLRIDSATAAVLKGFDTARVQSILLKGASKREWLKDDPATPRWYSDCDLLVRHEDADTAADVLASLGFAPEVEIERMPAWWREHAVAWKRGNDGAIIDVHRTLPGVGVDDSLTWSVLWGDAETIEVGGRQAFALSIPARAMHLAIHAAQHGSAWSSGVRDLASALDRTDAKTWLDAAQIARKLDAIPAFAAGLQLVPAGLALVERLGIVSTPSSEVLFREHPAALTVDRFAQAGDARTRASIVARKLIPPVTYMRHWSPLARRSRFGLLAAYGWRPLWVLIRAPGAVRAWLVADRLRRR